MVEESFSRGQVLGRGDLGFIFLEGPEGPVKDLGVVYYAIYYLEGDQVERVGSPVYMAENPGSGEYYVNMKIPSQAKKGQYRVIWYWAEEGEEQSTAKLVTPFRVEESFNV